MRRPRNWLHLGARLTAIMAAIAVGVLVFSLLMREKVTQQNFDKIRVGMSQAELHALLGQPGYQAKEFGLVDGPNLFTTNHHITKDEALQRGFKAYRFEQWYSPDLYIIVISDLQGRVVSRYNGRGRRSNWAAMILQRMTGWIRGR